MESKVDPNTAEFSISLNGDVTGQLWHGTFRAKKRLSHLDRLRRDQIRRELLGEAATSSASLEAQSLATGIADLKVRLTSSPLWWSAVEDGLKLEDENVLVEIFTKAVAVETDTKKAMQEAAKAAAEALKKE